MVKRLRGRPHRQLPLHDTWGVFFTLGVVLLNFPFLGIFNKPAVISGFPLLFIYLFLGWVLSIVIIFLFSISAGVKQTEKHKP